MDPLIVVVDEVLSDFQSQVEFRQYANACSTFYKKSFERNESTSAYMESDRTVSCEFNVGLWNESLKSAYASMTHRKYPHHATIKEFLNYLLNYHSHIDFGLIDIFFHKLFMLHPPRSGNVKFYLEILCSSYIRVEEKCTEERRAFDCILDFLFDCYNGMCTADNIDCSMKNAHLSEITEMQGAASGSNTCSLFNRENMRHFKDLKWADQVKRCLYALNFMYRILEADFSHWVQLVDQKYCNDEGSSKPLICHILWPEKRNQGTYNRVIERIFKTFIAQIQSIHHSFPYWYTIKKLVALTAETVRIFDRANNLKYPYLGMKTKNLGRELSVKVFEVLQNCREERDFNRIIDLMESLQPEWFRLLLLSQILTILTGYQSSPELSDLCDLLSCIVLMRRGDESETGKTSLTHDDTVDWNRVRKLRSRTSVNIKHKGRTRLQAACLSNNVEEVKALLTFPELDLNGTDVNHWTALHLACQKGSTACVRQLLFSLHGNSGTRINTRAKGPENQTPLMCAVVGEHADICHLLLTHSGSALLEDVDDSNRTASDMSENEEITRIIKHYETISSMAVPCRLENFHLPEKYGKLALTLCMDMMVAYVSVHSTAEVCKKLRENGDADKSYHVSDTDINMDSPWDYNRYRKDLYRNVAKLKNLRIPLAGLKDFESSRDLFDRILHLIDLNR